MGCKIYGEKDSLRLAPIYCLHQYIHCIIRHTTSRRLLVGLRRWCTAKSPFRGNSLSNGAAEPPIRISVSGFGAGDWPRLARRQYAADHQPYTRVVQSEPAVLCRDSACLLLTAAGWLPGWINHQMNIRRPWETSLRVVWTRRETVQDAHHKSDVQWMDA